MLSSTERRILYEKKLRQGLTQDEAYKAVAKDIEQLKKTEKKLNKNKPIKIDFKEEFKKLTKK